MGRDFVRFFEGGPKMRIPCEILNKFFIHLENALHILHKAKLFRRNQHLRIDIM